MIAIDKFSMFSSSLKLKGNKTNLENDETTKINVPKIFDIKTNEQKLGNNDQLQKSKDEEQSKINLDDDYLELSF